jgi:uncharacterized membrane protein
MTLPEIVLPKIVLPFDIPVLLHPFVVHFLIAIPVVVLLLELMNLMMKKKAVGGVSFFLILLIVIAAVGAYFTGLTDGKEAFPALGEVAKTALSEHKLLGTYLLLASALILLLKLLAMTGNKILKGLYILVLIAFVVLTLKQGKEGGALVYQHGLNVTQKVVPDKTSTVEEVKEEVVNETPVVEVRSETVEVEKVTPPTVENVVPTVVSTPAQSPIETTGIETVGTPAQESIDVVTDKAVVIPTVEEIPTPQQ